jgi:alpha-maltose-1-phosphate synthase
MKVLMLLDNPFTNDRRVMKEAETLVENNFIVEIICTKQKGLIEREFISGISVKREIEYKRQLSEKISKDNIDILHCHDQEMLNLGGLIKSIKKNKYKEDICLIYDSHELFHSYPLNISNYSNFILYLKSLIVKKFQILREKNNNKFIDYLITVNGSLANNLKEYFQLKENPVIVRNIPDYVSTKTENIIREKFNIPEEQKVLVFIGANIYPKTLNLEQVISEFANDKNITLVFIAKKNAFQKDIEVFVTQIGANNILFHDIVHPVEIIKYLSSCDIGLVPTWNKKDLSYWYALDNKLFEYLMAEIPILATQQPEYVNIVDKYKIGICINPDEEGAYLKGFNQIIKNYDFYKENTKLAKEELNWNNEKQELLNLYQKISANLSA